jgi:U3 small nucleolar RNA-associated protein 19
LAKIFSEVFTKPSYALEDFLDHTYATVSVWMLLSSASNGSIDDKRLQLFETEIKRKLKKDPVVALEPAANSFPASALEAGQTSDVVSELWVF